MSLEVVRMTIDKILEKLELGEWQIPKFQREFVWTPEQVFGLLNSIFRSRPIGLVTLWAQPQGNPHTPSEPITLRDAEFRHFTSNPAVMKLVLDGRQRLTTMAIAFGGLRESDARRNYSGRWFLNIDVDPEGEQFVVYRKPQQVESEQLKSMAVCLAKALIPLDEYSKFKQYASNVNNADFYPKDSLPGAAIREKRGERLANFHECYLRFQVPVAELPDSVSLAEVCEIFDVLNTTATKVSTFDLIHNLNFAVTRGTFDLRTDSPKNRPSGCTFIISTRRIGARTTRDSIRSYRTTTPYQTRLPISSRSGPPRTIRGKRNLRPPRSRNLD